jgi:tetratricopeptide (TPR) repeat protein
MRRSIAIASRAAAVLLFAGAVYRLCVLPVRASHVLRVVDARTHFALERSSDEKAMKLAEGNLERLHEVAPGCALDVDYFLLSAINHGIVHRPQEALQDLDRGQRVEDRPEIYFNRGMILFEAGQIDAAVNSFAIAARFNPLLLDNLQGELRTRVATAAAKPLPAQRP